MADINWMDLDEFVDEGFLQEVNRQFFHPLGLALADELFEESLRHKDMAINNADCNGLPPRVFYALSRVGYRLKDENEEWLPSIDSVRLKKDVLSGQIWTKKNIGEKTVRIVCEWLVAKDNELSNT